MNSTNNFLTISHRIDFSLNFSYLFLRHTEKKNPVNIWFFLYICKYTMILPDVWKLRDFLCTADKQSFCKYEVDLMSLINNINIRILRWLHVNVNDIEWEKPNGIRDGSFHVNSCYSALTDGKHVLDENMFWEKNDLRINITPVLRMKNQTAGFLYVTAGAYCNVKGVSSFLFHFFPLFSVYHCWKLVFNFICKECYRKMNNYIFTGSWRNIKNFNLNNTIPCYEIYIISRTSHMNPKKYQGEKYFSK